MRPAMTDKEKKKKKQENSWPPADQQNETAAGSLTLVKNKFWLALQHGSFVLRKSEAVYFDLFLFIIFFSTREAAWSKHHELSIHYLNSA